MLACASLLKLRGLGLRLPKSMSDAEKFICRLPWSISSHFIATQSWSVCCSQKCKKIRQNASFKGTRSFKLIDPKNFSFGSLLLHCRILCPSLGQIMSHKNDWCPAEWIHAQCFWNSAPNTSSVVASPQPNHSFSHPATGSNKSISQ